jgi:hypothetical protein
MPTGRVTPGHSRAIASRGRTSSLHPLRDDAEPPTRRADRPRLNARRFSFTDRAASPGTLQTLGSGQRRAARTVSQSNKERRQCR